MTLDDLVNKKAKLERDFSDNVIPLLIYLIQLYVKYIFPPYTTQM